MSSARCPPLGCVTAAPLLSFLDVCHGVRRSAIMTAGMPYLAEVHSRLMSIIHTVVVSDGQSIWGLGRKPGMVLKVKLAFRCLTFISARQSNDSHVYTLSSVASRDASARFHVGRRPKLSRQSLATFL